MSSSARKMLALVAASFALVILILNGHSPVAATPLAQPTPIPADIQRKLEPALLKQLLTEKDALTPFIAIMREQPSLSVDSVLPRAAQRASLVQSMRATASRAQPRALALLAARQTLKRAAAVQPLWIIDAVAGQADRATIFDLAALPEVALVRADHVRQLINDTVVPVALTTVPPESTPLRSPMPVLLPNLAPVTAAAPTIEWNIHQIGADHVWNAFNIDGTGVVVASMDSGVDWQHPALLSKYRGYRSVGPAIHTGNWLDVSGLDYQYPGDGLGHGTHTMGTIVGSTADHVVGVAPGAQWIAAKIFTNAGYATDSGIHTAFQWIIAPADDPGLAPDIVSNSWGTDNGFDTTFRADVLAVRAAGILTVFSNGNSGVYGPGTVGAPASMPETLAVGATDNTDTVADFSSRGPSPLTGGIKPDVSAPGVNVVSAVPGGSYAALSGTSMSAPHVSGLAALLHQARPNISITDTIYIITSTASPLGTPLPNNDTGWGRVDAYAAVLKVTASGLLSGTITSGATPLAGAHIVASDHLSRTTETTTDAAGRYQMPLSEDRYAVSAFAFGYAPALNTSLLITSNLTTTFDANLSALPTANVRGHITDFSNAHPLTATISVLGAPASTTAAADGFYSLTLPAGTYSMRAATWLHKIITASVTLQSGDVITHDFALLPAPSIVLVDTGAWYYGSQISFYQQALDELGYLYSTFTVTNPVSNTPTITTLKPYSITVWSAPADSPDYLNLGYLLEQYLDGGGRLFLSGQDIAYWDGGGQGGFLGYDYFPDRLHGKFLADTNRSATAHGLAGEALQGITLTINYSDSARNQYSADAVVPLDEVARPLAQYADGGIAGLSASTCLPYRIVYLGFGLEGAGPYSARRQSMQGVIDWLVAPAPLNAFSLSGDPAISIGLPGTVVTHALTLRNVGQQSDTYSLTVGSKLWPASLVVNETHAPAPSVVNLPSCASARIGVQTAIAGGAARNISDTLSVAASALSGGPVVTRTLVTKTPAPVLLVDDDRWYDQQAHYFAALNAAQIPFDYFDTHGGQGPDIATMQMYPQVAWFSAYDWFDPLNGVDEDHIAAYLNGGGRIFYTAQDYLAVRFGASNFARDYFGVLTYTNDVTVTLMRGAPDSPIGGSLGTYSLTYPYFNFSDYVSPTLTATVAFIGNNKAPAGVALFNPATHAKSVFLAFPFETIADAQSPLVMSQIAGWLGPLGDIGPLAPASVPTNTQFTYRLPLATTNTAYATSARVTVTLPSEVGLVTLGDPSLTYDGPSHSVRWNGSVTPTRTLTWTVQLNPATPPGTVIAANATIQDIDEGITFTRVARTFVERSRIYLPVVGR